VGGKCAGDNQSLISLLKVEIIPIFINIVNNHLLPIFINIQKFQRTGPFCFYIRDTLDEREARKTLSIIQNQFDQDLDRLGTEEI